MDPAACGDEQGALVTSHEQDDPGHRDRDGTQDDQPGGLALERIVASKSEDGKECRDRGDDGEEEPDTDSEPGRPTLPHKREAEEDRDEAVEPGQDQEWNGVQEHQLTCGDDRQVQPGRHATARALRLRLKTGKGPPLGG